MITNEALMVLKNNLVFTKRVTRQYSDKFGQEGAKIGSVLNVRKPVRYTVSSGPALNVQDITETQVAVTLDQQKHVDLNFTSADLLLSIDEFSDRLIKPAIAALANQIDYDGFQLYKQVPNFVGTVGTTPSALLTYLLAGVALDNNATPVDDMRSICINSLMQATIVDGLKGLFSSQPQLKAQYEKGRMGHAAGFDWYMDQNVAAHTVGALGGTPAVNGAAQSGASIITNGWTASAAPRLKKGDIITFASVNGVNPQSLQSTGSLQQFTVTADVSSDGSGNATIGIYPAITLAGPFQNVTAGPTNGALISVFSTAAAGQGTLASTVTPQGLAFHRDAFTLVTADLPMPKGVDMAARVSDSDTGISIRMVRAYDISQDKFPCRLDVLYGWAAVRPELACRIAG